MSGILFEQRSPAARPSPNRADVALFVGAIRRRAGANVDPVQPRARAAHALYRWLEAGRWTIEANRRDRRPLEELLDIPVPLESWAEFDRLFDWQIRPLTDEHAAETYLGAAVRAFFEEGGRRCYVVRVSDPLPLARRNELLPFLAPNQVGRPLGSGVDRSTWRGLWHLYGLPDVSFASLPDLPDACAAPPGPPPPLPEIPPAPQEIFVECAAPVPAPPPPSFAQAFAAPRCDGAGYRRWSGTLRAALEGISRLEASASLREVQLVAAVPLPDGQEVSDGDLLGYLESEQGLDLPPPDGLASAFLQLVYPWVRAPRSPALPEGLANPEGPAVGILARNALTRGTFRSAAGQPLLTAVEVSPALRAHETALVQGGAVDDGEQLASTRFADAASSRPAETLVRRVSLLGPSPGGMRLLSDVTTSRHRGYRQAQIGRLVSAIVRAARRVGEANVFGPSGPALWGSVRDQVATVLQGLWRAGALQGTTEREAFTVRCDGSTMTRGDVDLGRVIVEVQFEAAAAIERLTVSLALGGDGTFALTRAA